MEGGLSEFIEIFNIIYRNTGARPCAPYSQLIDKRTRASAWTVAVMCGINHELTFVRPCHLQRIMPKESKPTRRLTGYRKWEAEIERSERDKPIGSIISEMTSRFGFSERLLEQRALKLWAETVGTNIAEVTIPKSIKDGLLKVTVSNPSWKQELTYLSNDIRTKLNLALGKQVVSSIKFL
jgi:hypothetical protein